MMEQPGWRSRSRRRGHKPTEPMMTGMTTGVVSRAFSMFWGRPLLRLASGQKRMQPPLRCFVGRSNRPRPSSTRSGGEGRRSEVRADRAEQGREGERSRADALRDRLEVLQAHAEERAGRAENDVFELKGQLATAQSAAAEAGREAEAARQATHAFLDEAAARRSLGLLARLRAAWRGE